MFIEETQPRRDRWAVGATPSLASDLSWLLSVAARPSMQARYPQLAEMFDGREDLAERVRAFWGEDSEEPCFTEMQVLAHHGGAIDETDPDGPVAGHRGRGGHRAAGPRHPVGVPRGPRRLPGAASACSRSPPSSSAGTSTSCGRSGLR